MSACGGSTSHSALLLYVVPAFGATINIALFLSPMKEVLRARKDQRIGALNWFPLVMVFLNCTVRLLYSVTITNWFVFAANFPGLALGLFYTLSVFHLLPIESRRQAEKLIVGLLSMAAMVGVIVGISVTDCRARINIVGILSNFILVAFLSSPLSTLREIVKTKSAESLIPLLILCQLLNCALWTTYGFTIGDWYISGPNLVGFLVGLSQLALWVQFRGNSSQLTNPGPMDTEANDGMTPLKCAKDQDHNDCIGILNSSAVLETNRARKMALRDFGAQFKDDHDSRA